MRPTSMARSFRSASASSGASRSAEGGRVSYTALHGAGRESFEPALRVLQFPVRTQAEASPERASLRRSPLPERARRSLKTQQHAHHTVLTSTEWCPGLTLHARQRAWRYELTRLTEASRCTRCLIQSRRTSVTAAGLRVSGQ